LHDTEKSSPRGIQGASVGESSIGEIHSLYQDLFLTDIK
jgi:hypothetical protein